MSPSTSRTIVLVAGGFMFAAIALKRDRITDPFRFAWAAGVITLGLSLLSDIAPEVAGPFAILVLMAVYWRNQGVLGSILPGGAAAAGAPPGVAGPVGAPSRSSSPPAGPVGPVG